MDKLNFASSIETVVNICTGVTMRIQGIPADRVNAVINSIRQLPGGWGLLEIQQHQVAATPLPGESGEELPSNTTMYNKLTKRLLTILPTGSRVVSHRRNGFSEILGTRETRDATWKRAVVWEANGRMFTLIPPMPQAENSANALQGGGPEAAQPYCLPESVLHTHFTDQDDRIVQHSFIYYLRESCEAAGASVWAGKSPQGVTFRIQGIATKVVKRILEKVANQIGCPVSIHHYRVAATPLPGENGQAFPENTIMLMSLSRETFFRFGEWNYSLFVEGQGGFDFFAWATPRTRASVEGSSTFAFP
jgi:hypothetical protein